MSWSNMSSITATTWIQTDDVWDGQDVVKSTTTHAGSETWEDIPNGGYYLFISGSAFSNSGRSVTVTFNGTTVTATRVTNGTVYGYRTNLLTLSADSTIGITYNAGGL